MSNKIFIEEYIQKLNVKIPNKEEFVRLSKILPINPEYGENFIINYERGMLLYALITKFQPKTVLEIGTASGYSTICMAWAMNDNNIDGKIFTIDPKSHHEVLERKMEGEVTTLFLSRHDLWKKFISSKWIEKIEVLTGYSYDILNKKNLPKMEFSYIDGSHVYTAVKQDFFRILEIIPEKFNILFDDYVPNENDGVTKLIDEEISNVFETTFIKTNTKKQRIETRGEAYKNNELVMCLIGSSSLKKPLWEIFDKKYVNDYLNKNKFWNERIKIRSKINKKIPFLKNIRFQWWKKI